MSDTKLPRVLGLWDIVAIVIGGIIGSGIFIVPAAVAMEIKTPWLLLTVWVVGGLLTLFGALTFAELGAAYPEAGGMYIYLREAYGPLVSFLFGWTLFLVIDTGAVATLAVAFSSKYLPHFLDISPLLQKLFAAMMIVALVIINYLGVRLGANVQNVLTLFKFIALAGIGLTVFLFADGSSSHFAQPAIESFSWSLWGPIGVALLAVFWAYKGWEAATYSAGETRNPARNLPWGLVIGTVAVIVIYFITNLAYLYAFPTSKIAGSERIASDAMNLAVGPWGASLIAAIILVSIAGAANQVLLTSPRVYFAMARDGLFFRKVSSVHERYLTPHMAIVAMGVWSVILSLSGTFEELFTYVIFGQWIFFGLTAGAVIVLRKKQPGRPRPYRVPGYPWIPMVFICCALFISVNTLLNQFWNALAGLVIIILGLPAFFYWRNKDREPRTADDGGKKVEESNSQKVHE